ncbi:hypothetical protein [Undibacterium sp.]|uniref:hypothetical protein n=1 Tax=Undibacterium sp. TaxID=1914977 RepID=UPI0025F0274A|nr:hypothetical protein [Undibacterium sp.]
MNPIYCHPISLKLTPSKWKSGKEFPDMFNISLLYRPEGYLSDYFDVHIPKELQPAMNSGHVIGFHLETLEFQGVSSRALPGAPTYAIFRVSLEDDTDIEMIPKSLLYERRERLILGITACLLGGVMVFSYYAWLGALALIFGTQALRAAKHIPHLPLIITGEHR